MNDHHNPAPLPISLSSEHLLMLEELVPYLCKLTDGQVTNLAQAAQWLLTLAIRDAHREQRHAESMAGAFAELDEAPRVLGNRS